MPSVCKLDDELGKNLFEVRASIGRVHQLLALKGARWVD